MADVTDSVIITGGNQHVEKPASWHVWEIDVPTGVLVDSGVSDILLPDVFPYGTYILGAIIQTVRIATITGTILADLETALITRATGTVTDHNDLITGNDLETLDSAAVPAASSTLLTDWYALGGTAEMAAGTVDGKLNVEITADAAYTTDTPKIVVGALLARLDY